MTDRTFRLPSNWADADRPLRITFVGAGGNGSQMADQLASLQATLMALGHPGFQVTLLDQDEVTPSNVGRQRYTSHDCGQNKALLLVNRINAFYGLDWTPVPEHHDPRSETSFWHLPDLFITCVDKASYRVELARAIRAKAKDRVHRDCLWLDLGNGNRADGTTHGQVVLGHLLATQPDARLPHVLDLYPELAELQALDDEQPSCSAEESLRRQPWPINRTLSMLASELLWNLLRHGSLAHHGYHLSLNPVSVQPINIDPAVWAFYGYTPPQAPARRSSSSRKAA